MQRRPFSPVRSITAAPAADDARVLAMGLLLLTLLTVILIPLTGAAWTPAT